MEIWRYGRIAMRSASRRIAEGMACPDLRKALGTKMKTGHRLRSPPCRGDGHHIENRKVIGRFADWGELRNDQHCLRDYELVNISVIFLFW